MMKIRNREKRPQCVNTKGSLDTYPAAERFAAMIESTSASFCSLVQLRFRTAADARSAWTPATRRVSSFWPSGVCGKYNLILTGTLRGTAFTSFNTYFA